LSTVDRSRGRDGNCRSEALTTSKTREKEEWDTIGPVTKLVKNKSAQQIGERFKGIIDS
jgi:hypothetical protein